MTRIEVFLVLVLAGAMISIAQFDLDHGRLPMDQGAYENSGGEG